MKTSSLMQKMIWSVVSVIVAACSAQQRGEDTIVDVFSLTHASAPYFTADVKGNTVLCWTGTSDSILYYTVYDRQAGTFGTPVAVTPSRGTTARGESMNKVAFRGDGTVVAVFEKKHPTERNKYAGAIFYVQSFDGGVSWTKAKFIHSDTLEDNSRSYFDVAMLPDGEVGAVWLDGRLRLGSEGSSLFFAKTKGHEGFQGDKQIGETVCQCCRTDISTDPKGNVHVIFRDIELTAAGAVRDFVHMVSTDTGKTFTAPRVVSNDHWIVDGCPHTGASMAVSDGRLEVVWFTAGGRPGLYYSFSLDDGKTFAPRELISENARHPQMVSANGWAAIVVEESEQGNSVAVSHGGHHEPATTPSVVVWWRNKEGNLAHTVADDNGGEFPVATLVDEETLLVGYEARGGVVVRRIRN
jgi:hypothetical protein